MKKRVIMWAAIVTFVLVAVYMGAAFFFQSHFCPGTTIDGIAVGGYDVAKVEERIRQEVGNYSLTLNGRENVSEVIAGSSIGIEPVFDGGIDRLMEEQNGFAWIAVLSNGEALELGTVVSYDEEALEEAIGGLSFMKRENQRKPVDATYSEYSKEDGYTLIPADYGTTINRSALKKAVSEAVMSLDESLDLDESGCYTEPGVKDDDAKLLALLDELNQYAGTTITYEFGEKSEILDGERIHTWLSVENRRVKVDEEEVLAYVKELGKSYNTAYKPKTLETSYGTTVTISNGHYGWRIDNEGEVAQILLDLKEGKPVEREPVYAQTANSHGENDYGDSYVEINLTAQHLFLYKDGKLVIESDFVSGNVSRGHSSPTGAYGLTYKTTDAILRGEDYATPVKYWMPFAGDVGMHDATWRRSFGGNIYKTNGSHGCINLPFSAAKTIYSNIEKGFAVLVYTLPGTESKAVQKQDAGSVVSLIDTIGPVTLESETAITTARNLYNALPDSAKALVTNYETLVAAEAALAQLKAQQPQPPQEQQPQQPAEQPQQPAEQQPAEQPQQPAEQPPQEQQPQQPAEQPQQPAEQPPQEQQPQQPAEQPSQEQQPQS
ncbi:MAG: L,D-transpeptidase family protein [Roseburia sp.]|jgi:lipoprotein-anchoring transpeptidase ErfK/SrfK|nr:L,D-transpeptidase family protein [Roseburia sp.]